MVLKTAKTDQKNSCATELTHTLKQLVDEIRAYGKYAFWNDDENKSDIRVSMQEEKTIEIKKEKK
jgi:hypothetical protein